MTVLLRDLADTSAAVAGTPARLGKVGLLADVLGRADPAEAAAAVAFLSGELRQRQIGVGWATLREVPPPAEAPTLRVGAVDATFEEIGRQSGPGRRRPAGPCWPSCSPAPPRPSSGSCASCWSASCARVRWRASWSTRSPGRPACRPRTCGGR
jgi:hypothetical protein